jgi:hypothetical protein
MNVARDNAFFFKTVTLNIRSTSHWNAKLSSGSGAHPTESYKYCFTNICNLHIFLIYNYMLMFLCSANFFTNILGQSFWRMLVKEAKMRFTNIWKKMVGFIFHKFVTHICEKIFINMCEIGKFVFGRICTRIPITGVNMHPTCVPIKKGNEKVKRSRPRWVKINGESKTKWRWQLETIQFGTLKYWLDWRMARSSRAARWYIF